MKETTIDDQDIVLFEGSTALQPGEVEVHGLKGIQGFGGRLFGRKLDEVKADWHKVFGQAQEMIEAAQPESPKGFGLDTVTISLGFNAQGRLVFIAEAGVEATVSVTFKRA